MGDMMAEENFEEETCLYVLNGQQQKALKGGAQFVRKDFFKKGSLGRFVVSCGEGMADAKKKALLDQFGEETYKEREGKKRLDEEWKTCLREGDNLDALRLAKRSGMPQDPAVLELLFRRWRTDDASEYRLNWKYLCEYLPEFEERFGKETFLSLCNEHALVGDMYSAIEHERGNMQGYEAEYLHFCYSHRISKS